jgi:hypothetical protein
MSRILSVATFLLAFSHFASAQSFYASRQQRSLLLIAGTGTSTYFGELSNPGDYLDAKPSLNIGLQYYLNNFFSVRSEGTWFRLSGDDAKADSEGRRLRNLSFRSDNLELNLTGHISFFPQGKRFYQRPAFNLYAFGGIGFLYFNPTAQLNGERYALQPLQTEQVSYSRTSLVIPFGLGAKLKVGPFFNISIEGGYRKTFTDYLDDVSTVFPGSAAFSDPIAAALSDRGPEVGYTKFKAGSKRGSPQYLDGYFLLNAKIEYYLPYDFIFNTGGGGGPKSKLYKQKRKQYNKFNRKGGYKTKNRRR